MRFSKSMLTRDIYIRNVEYSHDHVLLKSIFCSNLHNVHQCLRTAMNSLNYGAGEALSEEEVQKTWKTLKDAFLHIYSSSPNALSFEELYRYAYTLVLHRRGPLLYDGTCKCIQEECSRLCKEICLEEKDKIFLRRLLDSWSAHAHNMRLISDILMYLDRNYVPVNRLPPIYTLGVRAFAEGVLRHELVLPRMKRAIIDIIEQERNGKCQDRSLITEWVSMLRALCEHVHLRVYSELFETPLLDSTRKYYENEANQYISNSVIEFLVRAETRIGEEEMRANECGYSDSIAAIRDVMYHVFIQQHFKTIIYCPQNGLRILIENDDLMALKRMYVHFVYVEVALKEMAQEFKTTLLSYGYGIINDEECKNDSIKFVTRFIELHRKFERILMRAANGNKTFRQAMKQGFEEILNAFESSAFHLSSYIDASMNALLGPDLNAENHTEHQTRAQEFYLDEILHLFRYIKDKDIFEAYYKTHLSRRLLQQRSVSLEKEKEMISKLKAECGQQYTSKMENMFKDLIVSQQVFDQFVKHREEYVDRAIELAQNFESSKALTSPQSEFHTFERHSTSAPSKGILSPKASVYQAEGQSVESEQCCGPVEFSASVLTQGAWPCTVQCICNVDILPQCIRPYVNAFTQFYHHHYQGRVLKWAVHEGRASVRANLGNSTREIECTTLQMCALHVFNYKDKYTLSDLLELLCGTYPSETAQELKLVLRRHVLSMCTQKCRLLLRNSENREPSDQDILIVNEDFTSPSFRIKVPLLAPKNISSTLSSDALDSPTPGADVPSSVEQDRNLLVDSAIVRVMKSRRQVTSQELMLLVEQYLNPRFNVSQSIIKQRLEKLIEREYIQRDENDRRIFTYVA